MLEQKHYRIVSNKTCNIFNSVPRPLISKTAISQTLSIVIVCSVVLAAFLGYGLSYLNRPSPVTTTMTANGTTSTVTVISVETQTLSNTKTLVTITEFVVSQGIVTYSITISGTCTFGQGIVVVIPSMTTTTYISPTNITGGFSATITTVSSRMVSTQVVTTTVTSTTSTSACPTVA